MFEYKVGTKLLWSPIAFVREFSRTRKMRVKIPTFKHRSLEFDAHVAGLI